MNYAIGKPVNEHGFRIALKTPVITSNKLPSVVSVDIAPRGSLKGFNRVAQALQSCGFNINPDNPQ